MSQTVQPAGGAKNVGPQLAFRWLWVGLPLAWGVWETAVKSLALFR
jgi:hypothetical protein